MRVVATVAASFGVPFDAQKLHILVFQTDFCEPLAAQLVAIFALAKVNAHNALGQR
jgi:hypothetical protein